MELAKLFLLSSITMPQMITLLAKLTAQHTSMELSPDQCKQVETHCWWQNQLHVLSQHQCNLNLKGKLDFGSVAVWLVPGHSVWSPMPCRAIINWLVFLGKHWELAKDAWLVQASVDRGVSTAQTQHLILPHCWMSSMAQCNLWGRPDQAAIHSKTEVLENGLATSLNPLAVSNKLCWKHRMKARFCCVDCHLVKETVQNILAFKFINAFAQASWCGMAMASIACNFHRPRNGSELLWQSPQTKSGTFVQHNVETFVVGCVWWTANDISHWWNLCLKWHQHLLQNCFVWHCLDGTKVHGCVASFHSSVQQPQDIRPAITQWIGLSSPLIQPKTHERARKFCSPNGLSVFLGCTKCQSSQTEFEFSVTLTFVEWLMTSFLFIWAMISQSTRLLCCMVAALFWFHAWKHHRWIHKSSVAVLSICH